MPHNVITWRQVNGTKSYKLERMIGGTVEYTYSYAALTDKTSVRDSGAEAGSPTAQIGGVDYAGPPKVRGNTVYTYRLSVKDIDGREHVVPPTAGDLTQPEAPRSLSIDSLSPSSLKVIWQNGDNDSWGGVNKGFVTYFVEWQTAAFGATGLIAASGSVVNNNGTAYDLTVATDSADGAGSPLLPNTRYNVRLRGRNDKGDSDLVQAFRYTRPEAPAFDEVTSPSSTQLLVKWISAPSDTAPTGENNLRYILEWSTQSNLSGASSASISNSGGGSALHSYTISGLTDDTMYYLRLRAVNEGGDSATAIDQFATLINPVTSSIATLNY